MFEKNEYSEQNLFNLQSIMKRSSGMRQFSVVFLLFILFTTGCSGIGSASMEKSDNSQDYYMLRSASGTAAKQSPAVPSNYKVLESQADLLAQKPDLDPARQERLVVYNGVINIVVERISDSISMIEKAVVNMGGYMQEMTSNSITLKVPAGKFQDAIAEAEKLGEVIKRDIKGTDVTEEMRDLNIRLQNAEQARDKMLSLLEKADAVEDTLKVEKELERITETIELLKGKISFLRNKISYSTLTVQFNSPIPQEDFTFAAPFIWVHALGSELTRPAGSAASQGSSVFNQSKFSLPDGYIKYFENKKQTRAMSADGVMIYVHKEKNYQGGNIDFWSSLVHRMLVEQKTIRITKQPELKLKNKKDAVMFVGSKQVGSKQYGYLAAIVPTKQNVYIFEAWGPMQEFEKDRVKLEEAVISMRLN
ncbi:MAG: DUF4349 domain-containing protein [Sedimentisphaerales bacterium]|nr:DUF4349 domain-containing protein [Sedimentisphaerales bacterium]